MRMKEISRLCDVVSVEMQCLLIKECLKSEKEKTTATPPEQNI